MASQDLSAASTPHGFGAGSHLANYLLEEQIGEGGMAVVFRARDERLGRTVALKILAPALAADEAFRQRFSRESRAAAAVDDPHILPVFEAGEADGVLFIAMRFVRGGDVRGLIRRNGRIAAARAVGIVSQAASGLDAAHEHGLVHRDVKPANMLLDERSNVGGDFDHVYLSDFGLSKASMHTTGLTGTGMFLGTLDYISPEQIEGAATDGRADQYSLACAAFELLSGSPPFKRQDAMAVMYAQLHAAPPALSDQLPGVPVTANDVFARALAKAPAERFANCAEFAAALGQALGVADGVTHPPTAAAIAPLAIARSAATGPPTAATGPPTEAAGRDRVSPPRPQPAAAAAAVVAAGTAAAGRSARRLWPSLLIGGCILVAAGLISGAILLGPAAGRAQHGQSAPPGTAQGAGHSSPAGEHARSSSPLAGTANQHAGRAASAGYRLVSALNPGASSTSISSVAWDARDSIVAASDKNGSTYLWNAATGAPHGLPLAGPDAAYSTAFSPDGTILATGYQDGSTSLWSTATGRLLTRLHDPGGSAGKEVDSVAFSGDGRTLATSDGNGYANLWRVGNGGASVVPIASLADPAGAGVYSVAFSSQGTIATGDYDGNVYLWSPAARTVAASFFLPGGACGVSQICAAVSGLAFTGDGAVLAAGNLSGNAELWSVRASRGAAIQTASEGSPVIWAMSFGGTNVLAVACGNGHAYLWRVNTARLTAAISGDVTDPRPGSLGVGAVTFSPDGRHLVTGDTSGVAYLWGGGARPRAASQSWSSSPALTITPASLGGVTIGMTLARASAAAGGALVPVGDGVYYPRGKTNGGLSVRADGAGGTVSCVSAVGRPGGPAVATPQGFRLGQTLAQLKAVYGSSLRYVPAPAGGIQPLPGYVVTSNAGTLVFWTTKGIVTHIAAGPHVLPSTDCT